MTISYEEKFKHLQNLLLANYVTFYVWKTLQNEKYNDLYSTNTGFWFSVIPALQHDWFIGLARLFENSTHTKNGKVISVYSLMQEHPNQVQAKQAQEFLDNNNGVIKNIGRIRDHRHAHNNARFLINPEEFESRFNIKYDELEGLFEFSNKLLGILHPESGHGYSLDYMKEESERHTRDVMDGLSYFNTKRKECRDRRLLHIKHIAEEMRE